jgi:hypothetical protein
MTTKLAWRESKWWMMINDFMRTLWPISAAP